MSQTGGPPRQQNERKKYDTASLPHGGASAGWRILSYMIGGMILYGGIGWLVGRWTGIAALFPVGMLFGLGLSILMVFLRYGRP
jgi:F0F1-type ATP synthase assembly protein I